MGDEATSPPTSSLRLWTITAIAYALAWAFSLCFLRGVWYDEIWSIWLTDRAIPFDELVGRWFRDVHPPTYYFVSWLILPLTGDGLPARRLENALALLAMVPPLVLRRKYRIEPGFLRSYLVLLASAPYALEYCAEYRSYFFQFVTSGALVLLVRMVHGLDRNVEWQRDHALLIPLLVLTALGLNLHFTETIIVGSLLGTEALHQIVRRRLVTAVFLLSVLLLGAVPLLATVNAMLTHVRPQTPNYTSSLSAIVIIVRMAILAVPNIPLLWALRPHAIRLPESDGDDRHSCIVVWLIAAVVAAAAIWILNVATHFLMARYLIGIVPLVIAPLALVTSETWSRPLPFIALCANAMLVVTGIGVVEARHARWETNVPIIRRTVAGCPSTRVIGIDSTYLAVGGTAARTIPGATDVTKLGYRWIGRRDGFNVEVWPGGRLAPFARGCPTILWVEQNFYDDALTADKLLRVTGLTVDPALLRSRQFLSSYSRALLILNPR